MNNINTMRQIGLMAGLVASVAIGAAVVLWLWIPMSESYPESNNAQYDVSEFRDGRSQISPQILSRDSAYQFNLQDGITDNNSKLLSLSGSQLKYTHNIETTYSQRIERLLEPLLGINSIRAQVTADIDFTEREQTLETYNPNTRILRNNELEETVNISDDNKKSEILNNRRHEINNYELDKTINRTRSAIGKINKLSIAVIVDDKISRGVKGNTIRTARTGDELKKLESLVKQTIGFNVKRGDIINVIGASFKSYRSPGSPSQNHISPGPTWNQIWLKDILNKVLGTMLVLLLIFLVIRPAIKSLINLPPYIPENGINYNSPQNETGGYPGKGASNDNDTYERNMNTASRVVENDPKLMAQVIKNWVSADAT